MPVGLLANTLMPQLPEHRSILCSVLIQTRFVTGIVCGMSVFFSFIFRTFLILHFDRGLVNKAGPNLKLFHQLFWTVLTTFILVILAIYPTSHQLKGIYPEGSKRGKMCLMLDFPGDNDFVSEGLKVRMFNIIIPFLLVVAVALLNMRVKRFLAGHCPRKRMSCIGVYQRNVITYSQTTLLVLCWVLSVFLDALLAFSVEINSQSWSRQMVFWLWNIKGFITNFVDLMLPIVMFVTPHEEIVNSSPVEFYTRKSVTLEPRRPETIPRRPDQIPRRSKKIPILIRVREAKQNEQPEPRKEPEEPPVLSIPPSLGRHQPSPPCLKYCRNRHGGILILDH
jgi:hypothetical protein